MKKDITISELGSRYGLSRSTLLYYDKLGLLRAKNRSGGNYRLYSQLDVDRLAQVCLYRKMGIPLKEIQRLLEHKGHTARRSREILSRRLETLESEIESLQAQQRQIVALLDGLSSMKPAHLGGETVPKARARAGRKIPLSLKHNLELENAMISKERWVAVMDAAGMTEQDKKNWHKQFEKMEPEAHQEFLESLGIPAEEIAAIRKHSRA